MADRLPPRVEGMSETAKTYRATSEGAERWLHRPIKCLDHGFVRLVDYMGNDTAIVQAARVSYGKGTKKITEDRGLIRYLRRHLHTTPFEMVEFKFHCKMPMFVARQWIRHRTANVNEYSARYSVLDNEFYLPQAENLAAQSMSNRQGREALLSPDEAREVLRLLKEDAAQAYEHYNYFLNDDGAGKPVDESRSMLARELARMNLPVNFYTQWYWKIDLHNLMHFLNLRMDSHALYEIRVFANAIARILADAMPISYAAFEDYQVNGMNLSGPEKEIVAKGTWPMSEQKAEKIALSLLDNNKRETAEFIEKARELGLIKAK
ncbi:MAG: FAD-dependent thymidylate synthase [Candidatus Spechtbacterales bacterium]